MKSMKFNLGTFWRLCCAAIAALFIFLRQIRLRPNFLRAVAVILVGLIPSMVSAQTVYHVDDDGPCGNGLTWETAMCYLQDALDAASAGDTIKVAQGIYYPDECDTCGVGGTDLQDVAFNIPLEVILEGGYVGYDELDPDVRDPDLFEETILSGDIEQDDTPSDSPTPDDIEGDNSFHVVTIINVDEVDPKFDLTHVDGFMITAGDALDPLSETFEGGGGGAFVVDWSLPKNYLGPFGEGPLFRNCIFQGNRALKTGGAIATLDVGLEVRDCQILNNESQGGQIWVQTNYSYTVTSGGGGVSGIGPMIAVNSTFIENVSTGTTSLVAGGGLNGQSWHEDNKIVVANCFFASNEAKVDTGDPSERGIGGGAHVGVLSIGVGYVMNCVFVNNLAENNSQAGSGLNASSGTFVSLSTFYANSAPNGVGGGLVYGDDPDYDAPANCIFWANTDGDTPGDALWRQQAHGGPCPIWSNIQDWNYIPCDGDTHNICANPEFVDPANDDFRLTKWSPSIEKGNDNLIPKDWGDVDDDGFFESEILPLDLAKKTRDKDAGFNPGGIEFDYDVDQGAYEYQCPACPWDLDHNGSVGTSDLLILISEWDNRCHAADFVLPDGVSTKDQLALLAHWGTCAPCFGGEGAGAAWDPQLVAAVQLMGFAGQADYTNWAMHDATDGQAFAATVVLAALLDS